MHMRIYNIPNKAPVFVIFNHDVIYFIFLLLSTEFISKR